MMTRQEARFRLDGTDFTRLVRDLFLSDSPSRAWRVVVSGLRGGTGQVEAVAGKILDGEVKLTGNETIGLTPKKDRAKAYRKQVAYVYAGRIRLDGVWFRPRAEVTDFGPDDAEYACRQERGTVPLGPASREQKNRWWRERVAFYAKDGERVVAVKSQGKGYPEQLVIFEPSAERPPWWNELPSVEAAVEEFIAARGPLQTEAWSMYYRRDEVDDGDDEVDDDDDDVEERQLKHACRVLGAEGEDDDSSTRAELLARIAATVRERAGNDRLDLTLADGTTLSVARAPFMNWALRRTSLRGLAPKWECVSPSGMKLPMDDPNHTDWLIEAGVSLEQAYRGPVCDASHEKSFEIQMELGHYECHVLVDGPSVSGTVGQEIVVLPDLREDRLDQVLHAKAIITEKGGKLAHLALVAMERQVPVLRVADAMRRFQPGMRVMVQPSEGRIEELFERVIRD